MWLDKLKKLFWIRTYKKRASESEEHIRKLLKDEKEIKNNNEDKNSEEVKDSWPFQSAVEKITELQQRIEYGYSLLRLNNWTNPRNINEQEKTLYEAYTSIIENLETQKQEVIEEIIDQIKQDEKYINISEENIKAIRNHINRASTWSDFYFNEEKINEIVNKSN